jgi:TctA family transporter
VGIKPGPDMLTSQLNLTFAVIWTLVIANIIATAICMIFAKPIAKVCFMPFYAIVPPVVAFVFIGAFAANFHTYDLTALMIFSSLGFFMRRTAGRARPWCSAWCWATRWNSTCGSPTPVMDSSGWHGRW